jgi:hypothetical protein
MSSTSVRRYNLRPSTVRATALRTTRSTVAMALSRAFLTLRDAYHYREIAMHSLREDDLYESIHRQGIANLARARAMEVITERLTLLYGADVAKRYRKNAVSSSLCELLYHDRVARRMAL